MTNLTNLNLTNALKFDHSGQKRQTRYSTMRKNWNLICDLVNVYSPSEWRTNLGVGLSAATDDIVHPEAMVPPLAEHGSHWFANRPLIPLNDRASSVRLNNGNVKHRSESPDGQANTNERNTSWPSSFPDQVGACTFAGTIVKLLVDLGDPCEVTATARAAVALVATRKLSVWAHELCHAGAALLLGYRCQTISVADYSHPCVAVEGKPTRADDSLIRHAGWLASVLLACVGSAAAWAALLEGCQADDYRVVVAAALLYTAAEAIQSDLLSSHHPLGQYFCGNFGLLLFQQASAKRVDRFLRHMLKVTMMRGAQSAGFVTYQRSKPGQADCVATRNRCVNGKRTDLSDKLFDQAKAATKPKAIRAPQIFQGHTRFATSSIADFAGTHPHQWTPKSTQTFWFDDDEWPDACVIKGERRNVEGYITHNGDLDFFEIHGIVRARGRRLPLPRRALSRWSHVPARAKPCWHRALFAPSPLCPLCSSPLTTTGVPMSPRLFASQVYALGDVQAILVALHHVGLPGEVDSMCVAGLLDLLRTQGLWLSSVRFGLIYGALRGKGSIVPLATKRGGLWTKAALAKVAAAFEKEWAGLVELTRQRGTSESSTRTAPAAKEGGAPPQIKIASLREAFLEVAIPTITNLLLSEASCALPVDPTDEATINAFVESSVDAFISQDLYTATRQLLGKAKGSFGLGMSHSLDASKELVLAARGQTISIAFYPQLGLVRSPPPALCPHRLPPPRPVSSPPTLSHSYMAPCLLHSLDSRRLHSVSLVPRRQPPRWRWVWQWMATCSTTRLSRRPRRRGGCRAMTIPSTAPRPRLDALWLA